MGGQEVRMHLHGKKFFFLALLAGVLLLAGCGNQASSNSGIEVQGKIIGPCGAPLPYKTVAIPGHDPVLTGLDGTFTISGVTAPYDLVISNAYLNHEGPSDLALVVYHGLTRPDPVAMAVDAGSDPEDSCAHAKVSGSITNYQEDATTSAALYMPPYFSERGMMSTGSNGVTYTRNITFAPNLAGNAHLLALQWLEDDTGNAASFVKYAKKSLTLDDGDEKAGEDLDLASDGLGSRALTVTVNMPQPLVLRNVLHFVTADGAFTGMETARLDQADADANGKFSFVGPTGAGLGSLVTVIARYGEGIRPSEADVAGMSVRGDMAGAWATADSGEVTVSFPDQPVLPITPLNGSPANSNATFRWMGPADAIYVSEFDLESRRGYVSVDVVTTGTALDLPDLSSLGFSLDSYIDNSATLYWQLAALGGSAVPDSMDELASADNATKLAAIITFGSPLASNSGYMFLVWGGVFGEGE